MVKSINTRDYHDWRVQFTLENSGIGFVPTMGALHEGHLYLVHQARQQCRHVVVSIFVNPRQFNDANDLKNYPIQLDEDVALLANEGVDVVLVPSVEEIYPAGDTASLDMSSYIHLAKGLEGEHRPGHFQGVVDVVSRLLTIVKPQKLYLGKKDYQQLRVLEAMTRREKFALDVIGIPTQRSASGLALSSRNALLSKAGIARASQIYKALQCAKESALCGDSAEVACGKGKAVLQSAEGVKEEYFLIANRHTMSVNEVGSPREWVVFCAAHVEGVRLIDNVEVFD